MSADLGFLEEVILTLGVTDLEWLQARISRRLEGMRSGITERRVLIRRR